MLELERVPFVSRRYSGTGRRLLLGAGANVLGGPYCGWVDGLLGIGFSGKLGTVVCGLSEGVAVVDGTLSSAGGPEVLGGAR